MLCLCVVCWQKLQKSSVFNLFLLCFHNWGHLALYRLVSFPASEGFWVRDGNYREMVIISPPSSPALLEASSAQNSLNYTALMYGEATGMMQDRKRKFFHLTRSLFLKSFLRSCQTARYLEKKFSWICCQTAHYLGKSWNVFVCCKNRKWDFTIF